MRIFSRPAVFSLLAIAAWSPSPGAQTSATTLRIMPADRTTIAVGQRFDLRVEATGVGESAPAGLEVRVDGLQITARNILVPGTGGERGAGGTGTPESGVSPRDRASAAPPNSTNFLLRDYAFETSGDHVIEAATADGARASVKIVVDDWQARRRTANGRRPARNVIFFLGDGMGMAHRTAARVVSRGVTGGRANAPLAMDTLEYTGQVMTSALNAVVTDSAPGMSSYVTGAKANNNQEGVFPDNTVKDAFDNPRIEYLIEVLRRTRGQGFGAGIITTADVTDATPGANAVHTADRGAAPEIAAHFLDDRDRTGLKVLMGGGARNFWPKSVANSGRRDDRDLAAEFKTAGFTPLGSRTELKSLLAAPKPPPALLGLFQARHMNVAFDKVGVGSYSSELALDKNKDWRDQPMLDEMTDLAIKSLSMHSPRGFYLLVEGASIDKQAHSLDADRAIWDIIEFDNAVAVALAFADRTNSDADPGNDTLVVVTADHETGGFSLVGVGNERYAPQTLGKAVRDYAAVFRFLPEQILNFDTNYTSDQAGYPVDPDPSRKLLIGWAAAPDHYENWLSNRIAYDSAAILEPLAGAAPSASGRRLSVAVANPHRDGLDTGTGNDNRTVSGVPVPGFLVPGIIENGELGCTPDAGCPADTSSSSQTISGHTASDVPLSATGPGALQFTGVYANSDVMLKLLRASEGTYPDRPGRAPYVKR